MRVEMLIKIGGFRDGQEWPDAGGTIDVPDHEAADLFQAGYAKEATDATAPDEVRPSDDQDAPATEDGDGAGEADEAPAKAKRVTRKAVAKKAPAPKG